MNGLQRLAVSIALICQLVAMAANAAEPDEASVQAVRAVINAQLAAFARNDAEDAFAYASDALRERFGEAANFMSMVRHRYAAVIRPQAVEYLAIDLLDGEVVQPVRFIDHSDALWIALYRMLRLPDGSWRINGVILKPLTGSGA